MANDKSGSDPGTPPQNPPPNALPPNPNAKVNIDQIIAEKAALENRVTEMQKTIDSLTAQLQSANDVLQAQAKEKLVRDILPRSNYTVEDLAVKSIEDLQDIKFTLDQVKLPTYKNIHFGSRGADEKEDGLTVGDLSVVTAAKRKAGGA